MSAPGSYSGALAHLADVRLVLLGEGLEFGQNGLGSGKLESGKRGPKNGLGFGQNGLGSGQPKLKTLALKHWLAWVHP